MAERSQDPFYDDGWRIIAVTYPGVVVVQDVEYPGRIMDGHDWKQFYFRPHQFDAMVGMIDDALNDLYGEHDAEIPSLFELGLWEQGMPCAARFTCDNKWYRARLEDPTYRMVRFVDYGTPQMCFTPDIKPLPQWIADMWCPGCLRCSLSETVQEYPSFPNTYAPNYTVTLLNSTDPYEVTIKDLGPSPTEWVRVAVRDMLRREDARNFSQAQENTDNAFLPTVDMDQLASVRWEPIAAFDLPPEGPIPETSRLQAQTVQRRDMF